MTEADRLLIAASRAIGVMRSLGRNDPTSPDEAQEILVTTRTLLRKEAANLSDAVEAYEKARGSME